TRPPGAVGNETTTLTRTTNHINEQGDPVRMRILVRIGAERLSAERQMRRSSMTWWCGLVALVVTLIIMTSFVEPAIGWGTQPLLGEVCVFAFDYCPRGFLAADGQLLAISVYDTLFSLLGTTYGGDGQANFALPDLRGRLIRGIGQGPGLASVSLGQEAGAE